MPRSYTDKCPVLFSEGGYCTHCGNSLIKANVGEGYDQTTGKKLTQIAYVCSLKYNNAKAMEKWRKEAVEAEEDFVSFLMSPKLWLILILVALIVVAAIASYA